MGKHGTEKVKMSSKKKIVIISIVVAVVIIAGLVASYFLFLRDNGSISKSRIKDDIANTKGVLSKKIGDYQQTFEIADFTYTTEEKDDQTSVSAKVDLENEVYAIDDLSVTLSYTKENGDYKVTTECDAESGALEAKAGLQESYILKDVQSQYKSAKLKNRKTDLEGNKDVITFNVKDSDMQGVVTATYNFDSENGWSLKKIDDSKLDIKNGKTKTVDVDGVKCYTNSAVKNILLLGTDADSGPRRSDSMILVSIDSNNKEIKFSSFMRDTYVDIDGYSKDKLNAAFAYGGPELATKTIEKNYGIKIDNYITTGFADFKKIVDALGGVEIKLDRDECGYINWQLGKNGQTATYGEVEVKDGVQKLNGQQALWFCRDRGSETYSGNDFTRTSRQRRMLMGLVESYKSSSVDKILSITNDLKKYVETDLSKQDLMWLVNHSDKLFTYKTSDKCYPEESSGWSAGSTDAGAWIISIDSWDATKKDIAHYIYTDLK
ncbi:MAG: LCP family protein [Ruminococcus sp.]